MGKEKKSEGVEREREREKAANGWLVSELEEACGY